MAVAGDGVPSFKIVKRDGEFRIVAKESAPGHILSGPELAHDGLLSGLTVRIAAKDRAALEHLLGAKIRS